MAKKILVVDDDLTVIRMLESLLGVAGYTVISSENGIDAMNKIKNENPDLVVLDLMLPDINGYDICRELRLNEEFLHIPIVILSARDQEIGTAIGMRLNISYLQKPIKQDILLERINRLLTLTEENQES